METIELELTLIINRHSKDFDNELKTSEALKSIFDERELLGKYKIKLQTEQCEIIKSYTEDRKERDRLVDIFVRNGLIELDKVFGEFRIYQRNSETEK